MLDKTLSYQLLKSKAPESSEVELHLFELCNLSCHFCGQDHSDRTGMDTIVQKSERVIEFIAKNPRRSHIVNVMGGEIFNDALDENFIDQYFLLAQKIHDFAASIGHKCKFNWVTNLVFRKHERVDRLLAMLDAAGISSDISTSYDFKGRKNKHWTEELWYQNLRRYKKRINVIGFVLTKPAIHYMLNEKDPLFDELYKEYPLYFDYYVPESGASLLMPTDEDLLSAFLFVAKNYPNINPVSDILKNAENKMTCYSTNKITLLPDGREVTCRYLKYKEGDFKHAVDYSSNDNIILGHLKENECLSCEWFSRCSFRCFVQADWAKRVRSPECFLKTFFKEISSWN